MTLFLNYLPYIVLIVGAYIFYKQWVKYAGDRNMQYRRMIQIVLGVVAILFVIMALSPTYSPTLRSERVSNPSFYIPSNDVPPVQNRLRQPARTGEESQERFEEITDWRKSVAPEKD